MSTLNTIAYYLANHPTIVNFRWSHSQSWGATWSFLISSLTLYVIISLTLNLFLTLINRRKPVPLGPIPAFHSLLMATFSLLIFFGILLSSIYEIKETRWLWRRIKTNPFQWLLCFPLGTRPSGRVFFWSYLYYVSRYLHLFRTFFLILRRRGNSLWRLFSHSALVCMSFVWLEFSQSFQVVGILISTLAQVVAFGYRFWVGVGGGGDSRCFEVVLGCQVGLLGLNLVCHFGVLMLHLLRGGCNGIGAWVFNSVLNGVMLLAFVCGIRGLILKRKQLVDVDDCGSAHPSLKKVD